MSTGAFRDTSAALERVAMLQEENEQLRTELAPLRGHREELEMLRADNATLRQAQRGENEAAFLKRLQEERLELVEENRTLRLRVAELESRLGRILAEYRRTKTPGSMQRFFDGLERVFGKKRDE